MSEIEVPLDKVQEDIQHFAEHSGGETMVNFSALLSALLAVAAAVCALFAGHYANDAMIEQIQSSDHWSYYQAKGIKLAIAESQNKSDKADNYKNEQIQIKEEAEKKESESRAHLKRHENLAASVTIFQVAIALTAIAVLTRKRTFLAGAATLGAGGLLWTFFSLFFS